VKPVSFAGYPTDLSNKVALLEKRIVELEVEVASLKEEQTKIGTKVYASVCRMLEKYGVVKC
jgi:hypothetical protein